jgi:hypothetical protein
MMPASAIGFKEKIHLQSQFGVLDSVCVSISVVAVGVEESFCSGGRVGSEGRESPNTSEKRDMAF